MRLLSRHHPGARAGEADQPARTRLVENAISKGSRSAAAFGDRVAGYAIRRNRARILFTMAKSTSFISARNPGAGLRPPPVHGGAARSCANRAKSLVIWALSDRIRRSASSARSAAARRALVGKSSGPEVSIRSAFGCRTERVLVLGSAPQSLPDRLSLPHLKLVRLVGDLARAFVGVRVGACIT